jgi:hypothetical protein
MNTGITADLSGDYRGNFGLDCLLPTGRCTVTARKAGNIRRGKPMQHVGRRLVRVARGVTEHPLVVIVLGTVLATGILAKLGLPPGSNGGTKLSSADRPALDVWVRPTGTGPGNWLPTLTARPDDALDWKLEFTNRSSDTVREVELRAALPAVLAVIPGSVRFYNSNRPDGTNLRSTALTKGGYDLGGYAPGSNVLVIFQTTVSTRWEGPCRVTSRGFGFASADGLERLSALADIRLDGCTSE